ncbi:hypothetical protein CLOM_g1553 [Closterium sp. NIES-68]|nr:hypothetical protein CLOM_g1553 [Closterium sp. NIES-68]GJP81596.1 hypothetical protein CLOP_g11739 [Closterium sp. NIES-67]GJP85948.1 hypothetical protein CLOP_g16035 [Closterium sp. NIES-67]
MAPRPDLLLFLAAALLFSSCHATRPGAAVADTQLAAQRRALASVSGWLQERFSKGLGYPYAGLAASIDGMDLSGDPTTAGVITFGILKIRNDYHIRYAVAVRVPTPGFPTALTVNSGFAGETGDVALDFGSDATWKNLTEQGAVVLNLALQSQGFPPMDPGAIGFIYAFTGIWYNAGARTAANGDTYQQVVDGMLGAPDGYYGLMSTADYSDGAARGQFVSQKVTLANKMANFLKRRIQRLRRSHRK